LPILHDPRQLASLQRGDEKASTPDAQSNKETKELVDQIRKDLETSFKITQPWRIQAEDSYAFVEGHGQWTDAEAKFLVSQKRPKLTFNKILPIIRLLSGIERQTREDIRVIPRKGSKSDDAQLFTELLKFIDDENLGRWQKTRKSQDVYVTGRGFIKTDINFDENIEGDIVFKRVNPLQVFVDPLAESWDGVDWRWVADTLWVTEDEAKELWPEFKDQIRVGEWIQDGIQAQPPDQIGDINWKDKLFLDENTKRVRIVEYWYKKWETITLAINRSTGDVVTDVDDDFLAALDQLPPQEKDKVEIIRRKVAVIKVATIMNWLLLQDKPSPFKHRMFPIVPYIGMQFWGEPMGIVEHLKDPQKFRNTAFSQMLNHLNRSANSGWLNSAGQGADVKQLELFGAQPGIVINYTDVEPKQIEPVQLSTGHFTLVNQADTEIQEISLINAEIQGTTTQRTISGRAIEARQRGGLSANEDFFDNALLGDKILGRQLIGLIQQYYDKDRIRLIADGLIAQDPNGVVGKLGEKDLDELIGNIVKSEYGFVIGHSPTSQTIRQVNLQSLLEMAKIYGPIIPVDAVIDLTDFPENIKQRIKQQALAMGAIPQKGGQGGGVNALGPQGGGEPASGTDIPAEELSGLRS